MHAPPGWAEWRPRRTVDPGERTPNTRALVIGLPSLENVGNNNCRDVKRAAVAPMRLFCALPLFAVAGLLQAQAPAAPAATTWVRASSTCSPKWA